MPQGNPKPGELYLHFKNKMYQIVTVAKHSETGEKLVIYQALYGDFQICARPFEMFISPVDAEKYPQVEQKYRFQLVERKEQKEIASEDSVNQPMGAVQEQETVQKPSEQLKQEEQTEQTEQTERTKQAEQLEQATPEEKMMAFFDADTIEEKYKIALKMSDCITNHMINNMAVVLDIVIEDGSVDKRFEELKNCLRTMQRYETTRLR